MVAGLGRLAVDDDAGEIDEAGRERLWIGPMEPDASHHADGILYQANRWRLTDDGVQWILWVRKGNPRKKASGYRAVAFCLQRTSLYRAMDGTTGDIPPAAKQILDGLPFRHPGPAR